MTRAFKILRGKLDNKMKTIFFVLFDVNLNKKNSMSL